MSSNSWDILVVGGHADGHVVRCDRHLRPRPPYEYTFPLQTAAGVVNERYRLVAVVQAFPAGEVTYYVYVVDGLNAKDMDRAAIQARMRAEGMLPTGFE